MPLHDLFVVPFSILTYIKVLFPGSEEVEAIQRRRGQTVKDPKKEKGQLSVFDSAAAHVWRCLALLWALLLLFSLLLLLEVASTLTCI